MKKKQFKGGINAPPSEVYVKMPDDYVEIFSSLWPKALEKLKSTVEET